MFDDDDDDLFGFEDDKPVEAPPSAADTTLASIISATASQAAPHASQTAAFMRNETQSQGMKFLVYM